MFTFAISCLTTSNFPWFMELTCQVPMQYCSLQHQTLLPSPVISTTQCCSLHSFWELFFQWSPLAYWVPTDLGVHLSVSYFFAFLCYSWGSQGKNTEVVCHSILQWITFIITLKKTKNTVLPVLLVPRALETYDDLDTKCSLGIS